MPRIAAAASIDDLVRDAVRPILARASQAIARSVADIVAVQLEAQLRNGATLKQTRVRRGQRGRARAEIAKWIPDRRARRVPSFVIEATGLDTKKKIVAKYGVNATFEKGKPTPPVVEKGSAEPRHLVRPKPPIIRKKGKAAA
jgi:hypothetical protein